MLFAGSQFNVAIYDVIGENVDKALVDIEAQLQNLESKGLLRGQINAKQQFALIRKADTLEDCLQNAIHVQVFLISIIDYCNYTQLKGQSVVPTFKIW